MKITFLSTMEGFAWGGSEELWFRVALRALEDGHSIQVCVKEWPAIPAKIALLKEKGAQLVFRKKTLPTRLDRIAGKFGAKKNTTEEFVNEIQRFNPDKILISQGGTFDFFRRTDLTDLIRNLNKPFSLISQFNFENGSVLDEKIRNEIYSSGKKWNRFYFVSGRNLESAKRQAIYDFPKAEIVSNPVNIQQPAKLEWPAGAVLRMASVARYQCALKGQDILMQTLASESLRHFQYELNLFGDGPDKQYLHDLIAHYGLQEKVKIAGQISDIDAIWAKHHVLVLPSIAEGTPLVLQECMLKGRPALTTDVGDCSRFVVEGETGFLCPVATPQYLEKTLLKLFSSSMEQLKWMGDRSFEKAIVLVDLQSDMKILNDLVRE